MEYLAAIRCLLSGRISDGTNPDKLTRAFTDRYAPSTVYLLNYGHHAISIALEAFKSRAPGRTEVIVPAYICPSVVEAVKTCGLIAVPVDIKDDLNIDTDAVAAALTNKTLAVIAPHMYGCPAPIEDIEKLCRGAGVYLIDDAAQVAGIHHEGRLLGTFGDIGLISFAQSKTVVTGIRGSGGILLVNNPDFDAEVGEACRNLPRSTGRLTTFLDFLWNYVWSAYTGHTGYYLQRIGERLGLKPQVQSAPTRISNLEAGIALTQLNRLKTIQNGKIRIVETYHHHLEKYQNIGFPQYAPGRYLARAMITVPESVNLINFRNHVKIAGIETRLGYIVYESPDKFNKNAYQLAHRLLEVPSGTGMKEIEIIEICKKLNAAINAASSEQE